MSNQTDREYVNYLNSISNSFQYYALVTILPTCVVGNLISLYIYTRPNLNKKTNTGFLYSWLCVLNVIMIVYYSFVSRSNNLFKYSISFPCGVESYIRRAALNSITWMQVVICFDRFVAVLFPTKTAFMSKKIVLYAIMMALFALILITNMTNLMSYPATSARDNRTSCSMTNDVSIATSLIANLMRIFIPFVVMLTLNLLVIFGLKKSKIKVGVANVIQIASKSRQQPLRRLTNKEFKFTVSTLIIDFIFLFFYLPLGVAFIIQTYNLFSTSLTSNLIGNAAYSLFNNVSQLFALAHTSVLIFLFIIFNRYFRAELILLLRLHKLFPNLKPESNTTMTRINNNQSQFF